MIGNLNQDTFFELPSDISVADVVHHKTFPVLVNLIVKYRSILILAVFPEITINIENEVRYFTECVIAGNQTIGHVIDNNRAETYIKQCCIEIERLIHDLELAESVSKIEEISDNNQRNTNELKDLLHLDDTKEVMQFLPESPLCKLCFDSHNINYQLQETPIDFENKVNDSRQRKSKRKNTLTKISLQKSPSERIYKRKQLQNKRLSRDVTAPLIKWLIEHQNCPYPTLEEKKMLSELTGISPLQVSNWMTNVRKRHLFPVISGKKSPKSFLDFHFLVQQEVGGDSTNITTTSTTTTTTTATPEHTLVDHQSTPPLSLHSYLYETPEQLHEVSLQLNDFCMSEHYPQLEEINLDIDVDVDVDISPHDHLPSLSPTRNTSDTTTSKSSSHSLYQDNDNDNDNSESFHDYFCYHHHHPFADSSISISGGEQSENEYFDNSTTPSERGAGAGAEGEEGEEHEVVGQDLGDDMHFDLLDFYDDNEHHQHSQLPGSSNSTITMEFSTMQLSKQHQLEENITAVDDMDTRQQLDVITTTNTRRKPSLVINTSQSYHDSSECSLTSSMDNKENSIYKCIHSDFSSQAHTPEAMGGMDWMTMLSPHHLYSDPEYHHYDSSSHHHHGERGECEDLFDVTNLEKFIGDTGGNSPTYYSSGDGSLQSPKRIGQFATTNLSFNPSPTTSRLTSQNDLFYSSRFIANLTG